MAIILTATAIGLLTLSMVTKLPYGLIRKISEINYNDIKVNFIKDNTLGDNLLPKFTHFFNLNLKKKSQSVQVEWKKCWNKLTVNTTLPTIICSFYHLPLFL